MAYCGPRGIPYTTWLADPWDDVSRAAAVAWAHREADRCGGCGLYRSDLLDAEGNELRDLPVELDVQSCPGCRKQAVAEKERSADDVEASRWRHVRWVPASTDVGDPVPEVTA